MSHPTVRVEPIDDLNALRMIWEHNIEAADVKPAFDKIVSALAWAANELYVIVDLTRDPKFPLAETMLSALPSYRHTRLAGWLVVGQNRFAQYISQFLGTAAGRSNILWFDTEEEALTALKGLMGEPLESSQ